MSVEAAVVTAVVTEGKSSLRKLYAEGISAEDFIVYREEIDWIEQRAMNHEPVNPILFRKHFPDFDWMPTKEDLKDYLAELKKERIVTEVQALLESTAGEIGQSDPVKIVQLLSEQSRAIMRLHSPQSRETYEGDIDKRMKEMRAGFALAKAGIPIGIPTGFVHLDHHWGGFVPSRMHLLLGRPGSGKSFAVARFAWYAKKNAYNVGLFSPEMTAHEHRSRIDTIASAEKEIQKALGLKGSFRNRALLDRRGFNLKQYQRFSRYVDDMPGRIHILSGVNERQKMSVAFIGQQIEELSLDFVIIDPIYKLRSLRRRTQGWEELGEISDALDDISKQYNIPIVVSNQAHRQGGASGDAPHKDRSFGSDVPVQNAAYVLGVLHQSEENLLIMRGSKSRFGQDFTFHQTFFANTGYFKDETSLPKHSYFNGKDDMSQGELTDILASVEQAVEA